MPTYWVAFAVIDGIAGQSGTGAVDVTIPGAPASEEDVIQLSDQITEIRRERGHLRPDQWVLVQGWSRMGD